MACYHPMAAIWIGNRDGTGKPEYRIVKWSEELYGREDITEVKKIPCGKCLGCRLQKGQDWSNRMLMEMKCHEENWFLTLTYDPERTGIKDEVLYYQDDSGAVTALETLVKRDAQLFVKNLRNYLTEKQKEDPLCDPKFKYYLIGEYGSTTFRPHYHGIFFGLHLPDASVKLGTPRGKNGDIIYWSDDLENKVWKKGFVELGSVTPASTSYVGRYVTSKLAVGHDEMLDQYGLQREFSLMSRRPGIGRKYFDDHPDMFQYGAAKLATEKGSVSIYPPRYFRDLIDDQETRTDRTVLAKLKDREKMKLTNLTHEEQLLAEEQIKNNQTNIIKHRDL